MSAVEDLVDACEFFESQGDGIGAKFLESLYADLDSLIDHAGLHPKYFEKYHRKLASRFPFAIYYELDRDVAVVCAVMDTRRDPEAVRRRLI